MTRAVTNRQGATLRALRRRDEQGHLPLARRRHQPQGAEKLLPDLGKRIHGGGYRAPERITLGDYLIERWLPTKQAQLRPSTFASYRNNVELHIAPRIGSIPLQKLQPEDLDTFYAELLRNGRASRSARADGGRLFAAW